MPAVTPLFNNELFSHGTYECNDMAATRRFLVDFLGLDLVRPLPEAQYMWKGGPWSVICVCVRDGEAKEQGAQNHFKLSVASDAEVDAARLAALAHRDDYGIKRVLDVRNGGRPSRLQAARPQQHLVGDQHGLAGLFRRRVRPRRRADCRAD